MQPDAESGNQFTSAPVAVGSLDKGYIGRNDGQVQQIDLRTGQTEKVVVVDSDPFAEVFDPSLDVEGVAPDFNRLVVVAGPVGGKVTRLTLPFCPVTPPSVPALPALMGVALAALLLFAWRCPRRSSA